MIGPSYTYHSTCLTLASDRVVLYGIVEFSFLVLPTKKRYSSFLKEICVFQKTCFKVKVSKAFNISSDCHINVCRDLNRGAVLKIPSTVF